MFLQFEPERYGKNVKRACRMTKVLKPGGRIEKVPRTLDREYHALLI